MTITIHLPPELETQLRENALAAGVAAEKFVVDALTDRLAQSSRTKGQTSFLSHDESQLLQAINQGLPEATWRRYHELIAKRRAETLTEAEHAELKSLTDEIELAHAKRLENLIQLAQLRHTTVDALMNELGIRDPGYD